MTSFVFLGAYSEVPNGGIRLTRFGQRVELPPELAESTKHPRGLPCIPAVDFDAIQPPFTPEELRKYGALATHETAPKEFLEKKRKARDILAKHRAGDGKPIDIKPEGK